jgi:hypothetical protein
MRRTNWDSCMKGVRVSSKVRREPQHTTGQQQHRGTLKRSVMWLYCVGVSVADVRIRHIQTGTIEFTIESTMSRHKKKSSIYKRSCM